MAVEDFGLELIKQGIPRDYANPLWDLEERVHCWRNHINEEVAEIWDTFTDPQKRILSKVAARQARLEEWE